MLFSSSAPSVLRRAASNSTNRFTFAKAEGKMSQPMYARRLKVHPPVRCVFDPSIQGRTDQFILSAVVTVIAYLGLTVSIRAADAPVPAPVAAERDGQHDFDFNFGTWRTHIKRIGNPFSPSSAPMALEGTVTVRKVWGGRAQLEEIEADGPKGHFEGLTLFLYNPESHQWSQTFASSKEGSLTPPLIGSFKGGRGELLAQDTLDNRSVLVRAVWSDIKPDSHHMEESYSNDGGKSWRPAFIADLTRLSHD
jgi:hypothetical protein